MTKLRSKRPNEKHQKTNICIYLCGKNDAKMMIINPGKNVYHYFKYAKLLHQEQQQ